MLHDALIEFEYSTTCKDCGNLLKAGMGELTPEFCEPAILSVLVLQGQVSNAEVFPYSGCDICPDSDGLGYESYTLIREA